VPVRLDVTNASDIADAAADCGDVTLLINNAGIAVRSSLLAVGSTETALRELKTNFVGPLEISKAFAPILASKGGGAIVNVLSVLSWLNTPGWSTHAVSKAAAWSLTNGLRNELIGQGTQVVGVHVARMDTRMARFVHGPKMDPAVVAQMTLEAIAMGKSEVLADPMTPDVQALLGAYIWACRPHRRRRSDQGAGHAMDGSVEQWRRFPCRRLNAPRRSCRRAFAS
jgi:short-subunit dehydrogenase